MSNCQDKSNSYDPAMPWLTRPGGIQLSDWPSDIVTPKMIAKEAKWAKAGEKYDFQGPGRGDHHNRYVKETKNGPVYKDPPHIHRASDHYMSPPSHARAQAANAPAKDHPKIEAARKRNGDVSVEVDDYWNDIAHDVNPQIAGIPPEDRAVFNAELQEFQRVNGDKPLRGLPDPIRDKERKAKQADTQLKKKAPEDTKGERSSSRLQQKAQAALKLLESKKAHEGTSQLLPPRTAPAPLLVRDSAVRSTLQNSRTNPDLASAIPPSSLAEVGSASNTNMASVDTETGDAISMIGSHSEPITSHKPTITNKESAISTKAVALTKRASATKTGSANKTAGAAQSAASTKTKTAPNATAVDNTAATIATTASTKTKVNKKAAVAPKTESFSQTMAATKSISKYSGSSKPSASSATTKGSRGVTQGITGNKGKAADTTTAAPVKRPRIGRACDACRDKKTRCDGSRPCEACTKRHSDCVYGDEHPQPNQSTQDPNHGPSGDDGRSGKTCQHISQLSNSKGNTIAPKTSSASYSVNEDKRKRVDEAADLTAQSRPIKKTRIFETKTILRSPAAQARLRAQQQLNDDIERFMQQHSPMPDAVLPKRKSVSSDEEVETQPAKLQHHAHYTFKVLENARLVMMQDVIIDVLAQFATDFKPLQQIGHLVKVGKLLPQIIDVSLQEEAFHNRPSIKLVLPDHIKGFLVDDWENVTKNNQLVHLPHPKPVEVILQDYLAAERPNREEGSTQMDILEETIAGLREYFDRALGRILLYRSVFI